MTARKELYDYLLDFFLKNPDFNQSDVKILAERAFNNSSQETVSKYIPLKINVVHKESETFESQNKKKERKAFIDKSTFEGYR